MCDDEILTFVNVDSPIMEEVYAAFDAISNLESLFLQNSDPGIDFSSFHSQFKHLSSFLTNYYGQPTIKEIEEELSSKKEAPFVPFCVQSYHNWPDLDCSEFPKINPNYPPATREEKDPKTTVRGLQYPAMTSVAFSLIDERPQLLQLIDSIKTQQEIGVSVIVHPKPVVLCAICISLRDCEYLIDVAEVLTAIEDLCPVFANGNITKVVHNTAHTCRYLHEFGAGEINNVFCITTAALWLNLPTSLADLTKEFRDRLHEGWIDTGMKTVKTKRLGETRNSDLMVKTIAEIKAKAIHDWRLRPISLEQMNLARQEQHYLLYLYDSLRCGLNEKGPGLMKYIFQISEHKASMRWDKYKFTLKIPNAVTLSSLYQQPLPSMTLFKSLMLLKQDHENELTDAMVLWIALEIPTTPEMMQEALEVCESNPEMLFTPESSVSTRTQQLMLALTSRHPLADKKKTEEKKEKTLDDLIKELGWVSTVDGEQTNKAKSSECTLETTISPRFVGKTERPDDNPSSSGGYLKHLRNPDQPTAVSQQIEGIPRTEPKIYMLASKARIQQKINGKTKAKLPPSKEEVIPEISPDDMLQKLVRIMYIDDIEKKSIIEKMRGPAPMEHRPRRAHSTDSKLSNAHPRDTASLPKQPPKPTPCLQNRGKIQTPRTNSYSGK